MADDSHHEARRVLERKALANVRALVDKVEARDRESADPIRLAKGVIPGLLGIGIVLAVLAVWATMNAPRINAPLPPVRTAAEYADRLAAKVVTQTSKRGSRRDLEGLEGQAELLIHVGANGYLSRFEITKPSWNNRVDDEAKRFVKGAEPFGALPSGIAAPFEAIAIVRFGTAGGGAPGSIRVTVRPVQ